MPLERIMGEIIASLYTTQSSGTKYHNWTVFPTSVFPLFPHNLYLPQRRHIQPTAATSTATATYGVRYLCVCV